MRRTAIIAGCATLAAACALWTAWADISDDDPVVGLLSVKRLFIEKLEGGDSAGQIRDMIIGSLQRSRLFIITENEDRADAVLKGSAEDMIFTDTFQTSEGVTGRTAFSSGTDRESSTRYTRGPSFSAGVGDNESTRIAERKHEAVAAVHRQDLGHRPVAERRLLGQHVAHAAGRRGVKPGFARQGRPTPAGPS